MTALVYLGGALVLFLLISLIAWYRHRERAITFSSSIERFRHEMGMLAPDDAETQRRRQRRH